MRFYRKTNYIQLLLGTFLVMIIRFILIHFFLIDSEIKTDFLCQLYFGGLSISDSIDLLKTSLYLAIIATEVIIINEEIMTGIFDNLEILLCRTTRKSSIYNDIVVMYVFNTLFITILNYIAFLAIEGYVPSVTDVGILLSEIILILVLDLLYFLLRCQFKNNLAYIGVLVIYFIPILLTGFLYAKGKDDWLKGKYFLLNNFIYNYTHEMEFHYQSYDYTFFTPILNLGIDSIGIEILIKCVILLLFLVIGKKSFLKYSVL